jgi:predicted phosphodiesterase
VRGIEEEVKMKVLCMGDVHIRATAPRCRKDDYREAMRKKLEAIRHLQLSNTYPELTLDAGDIFDYAKPSPNLLWFAISHLPVGLHSVPGNHDLPNHALTRLSDSGWHLLEKIGILNTPPHPRITYAPWGQDIAPKEGSDILIAHAMVWKKSPPWPNAEGYEARELLKKFPQFKLIVTGHHHQSFCAKYKGRWLVNPGSLMRSRTDQWDHEPTVYIWDEERNTVDPIVLPHLPPEQVMDEEHLRRMDEAERRRELSGEKLEELVQKLEENQDGYGGVSFEDALQRVQESNNTPALIREKEWEAVNNG